MVYLPLQHLIEYWAYTRSDCKALESSVIGSRFVSNQENSTVNRVPWS